MSFHLILPSNSSKEYYPANTLSKFSIKLSTPQTVSNYECALAEIMYPNRFYNIRTGFNKVTIYGPTSEHIVCIKPGYYDSVDSLISAIGVTLMEPLDGGLPDILITYDGNRINIVTSPPWAVVFQSDIAKILGLEVNTDSSSPWKGTSGLISGDRIAPYHASVAGGGSALLYVYSDLIRNQAIGGIEAPILRAVNLGMKGNSGEFISQRYERLYYVPLQNSHFDSINIELRDSTGELIHFAYGTVMLIIKFRPRKAI